MPPVSQLKLVVRRFEMMLDAAERETARLERKVKARVA